MRQSKLKWGKRALWSLVILIAVAYVGICGWLKTNETRLIYGRTHPYVPPSLSLALNPERVEFAELDGTKLFAWVIPSLREDTSNVWVLFFHGTGDNVSSHGYDYYRFRSMGFNIMAPEYPGYLDSPGVPSETPIEREAQAAYDYLRRAKHVAAKSIVIYGISLGAGVAIDLASRVEAGTLIVCAGFSSLIGVAQRQYPFLPMRLLLGNPFESDKKIGHARMPVLVIHSAEDDRFPLVEHGQRLYDLAPFPKQLLRIRGKHGPETTNATVNPSVFPGIVTFLNTEAGFQLRRPLPSIGPTIAATVETSGIEAGLAQYRSLRSENPSRYEFQEPELDHLGYELLARNRTPEAIAVLELNAERFPQSFGVHDSLGDAYVAAGRDAEAIESYRRSLSLFPGDGKFIRLKVDQLRRQPGGEKRETHD